MIQNWLEYNAQKPKTNFTFVMVSEKQVVDDEIKSVLKKEVFSAYRQFDYLEFQFKSEPQDKLIDYIDNYILPSTSDQISRNVWQGDFGEVLASLIVSYFRTLTIPIKKMRWKFNKDRSVFCTDMIAHNRGPKITDIYYYEIKTREKLLKKESVNELNAYITVHAHNSLLKDQQSSPEGIANFLAIYYYNSATESSEAATKKVFLDKSEKYGDIVKNPGLYHRHYELFLIGEKVSDISKILNELDILPPGLKPLNVTVVLISDFKKLVTDLRATIIPEIVNVVYGA